MTPSDPQRVEMAGGARRLILAAGSVIGHRYRENYDRLHLATAGRPLAVVADGMGDGEGSATAGRLAVAAFTSAVTEAGDRLGPVKLRAAVAAAQHEVVTAGLQLRELTGCTLTALAADGPDAWIVQIGDSRVYRLRGGQLELLTVDHTAAWLGAVHGWYPFDSAEAHRARYRLMRYIGHPDQPEPDVLHVSLRPGDVHLLCTDGLAEQVPYDRLAAVLGSRVPAEQKVATLLRDSLTAGGRDNATAIVVEVEV